MRGNYLLQVLHLFLLMKIFGLIFALTLHTFPTHPAIFWCRYWRGNNFTFLKHRGFWLFQSQILAIYPEEPAFFATMPVYANFANLSTCAFFWFEFPFFVCHTFVKYSQLVSVIDVLQDLPSINHFRCFVI